MASSQSNIPHLSELSPSGSPSQPDSGFGNPSSFNPPDDDPVLVEDAEKYKCPIHKGILRDPVQTQCGHRLCRECLLSYLGDNYSKPCPVPDEEVQEVSRDTIYPDPGFQREIKQLLVYCAHKTRGCTAKIKFRDYANHIKDCEYRPVDCKYKQRGCLKDVAWNAFDNHVKKCDYRPASCHLCGQEFNAKDIKDHETNHCPEGNVDCPYKCGKAKIKRRELDDHKSICPLKPTECQYKALGCDFTGDKSAVENHEKNVFKHFDFMVTFLVNLEMKFKEMEQSTLKQVENLRKFVEMNVKNINREFMLKTVTQTEKSLQLEKRIDEIALAQRDIQEQIVQLQQKIEQTKHTGGGQRHDSQQLSRIELRLAEMDLRFQMIETANYDGTLLWKIRDFSIRRRLVTRLIKKL